MATSTFNKEFRLMNSKEANAFAEAMSSVISPTLKRNYKSALKSEKEVRATLKKALK